LKKAFSGNLVDIRLDEETSESLLERIRKESNSFNEENIGQQKPKGAVRVKKNTKDLLRIWITDRTEPTFTFDELREDISADYELIQDAVFELLTEKKPLIEQFFDKGNGYIAFRRLGL
jgi:hypothetical protein